MPNYFKSRSLTTIPKAYETHFKKKHIRTNYNTTKNNGKRLFPASIS